jgi:hypothetical protein
MPKNPKKAQPKPYSLQHYALWDLIAEQERVEHVPATTWRALERRGWIDGTTVTRAGLLAMGLPARTPSTLKGAIRAACRALPWGERQEKPQFGRAMASITIDDPDDAEGYLSPGGDADCLGTVDINGELDWEQANPEQCASNIWAGVEAWLASLGHQVSFTTHSPEITQVRWIYQEPESP